MKRTIAIVACAAVLLLAGKANAQTGINIGYTPTTISTTSGNTHDTIALNGIAVGINQNVTLNGDLCLLVGVQARYGFAKKETNVDLGILGSANATAEYSQFSIDIPVLLNYGFNLGKDLRVTPFVGPTISFALAGKTKWSGNANVLGALNLGTDGEDDWYDEGSNNSRFDIGLTAGVNLAFSQFSVYGGYNLGLLNLSTADNTTRKSAGFFIGLGYKL